MLVVCIITGQTWWYELPSEFPATLRAAATPDDVAEGLESAAAAAHATTTPRADTACKCHVFSIFRWLARPKTGCGARESTTVESQIYRAGRKSMCFCDDDAA
jgi:hypothetical protein